MPVREYETRRRGALADSLQRGSLYSFLSTSCASNACSVVDEVSFAQSLGTPAAPSSRNRPLRRSRALERAQGAQTVFVIASVDLLAPYLR
jgi:hypothetical protein